MAVQWTGLGPELLLQVDRDGTDTLGEQLQSQLREAIQSGRLAPGEKLPSTRLLAGELGVSRGLVVDSYAQLESEGYLDSRGGSGTRVADCAKLCTVPSPSEPAPQARLLVDFAYGEPDLGMFPMRDWLWALGEAARDAPYVALANAEHHGIAPLREVVAGYVRRVRGSVCDPADVVVCTGFSQGLALVTWALHGLGIDTVAVEDPTTTSQGHGSVGRAGMTMTPVPVDEHGIDVAALAATNARAVVVTPAHQSPMGVVLSPERRHALVAWAAEHDGYIIEDDYDAEFRYDRQPVGTLQGLSPDRVFGISSTSKSLAPGMRLGWVVCPRAHTAAVIAEKELADRGTAGLDQLALAHLIRSGRYDRHLRRMRAIYGARREALVAAVDEHAPAVKITGLAAGMHAVFHLPDGVSEHAVVDGAHARGVGLSGMSQYRADGAVEPAQLLVGFGSVSESAIHRAIATIGDLLQP